MIWNTIPNDEKLRLWKHLRNEIEDLPLLDRLQKVAKFCFNMPIGSRSVDYYTPDDWPTPWEILFHGMFCSSSISLLIFYTLTLLPDPPKVELLLVDDEGDIYLLPVVNDQFILNYELGVVSMYPEIKDRFKIIKTYSQKQIKTIT